MAIEYLKRGKPDEAERAEDDAKVRGVVETTLADIEARGRRGGARAVRKVRRLRAASLPADRLRDIEALIAEGRDPARWTTSSSRRAGAPLRRGAARFHGGYRGGNAARRDPRPQEHPGAIGRLLRAGRQVSDGRLGAYVGG